MIYLLYGQPGSGKTTLGRMLVSSLLTPFHIDGDEFRGFFSNKNYNKAGRIENIKGAFAVATYLNHTQEEGVVLSLVCPYEYLRNELKRNNNSEVLEIHLTTTRTLRKKHHFEDFEIGSPRFCLNTDRKVGDTWESLKTMIEGKMANAVWK